MKKEYIPHKFKYPTKEQLSDRIKYLGLNFRYFIHDCCEGSMSIGWRQEEKFVEFGISIKNNLADQHDRRIAKDNIVSRFDKGEVFKFYFYDGFKDCANLTPSGKVRNNILIKLFIALYEAGLLSPKVFGFKRFPNVYLED